MKALELATDLKGAQAEITRLRAELEECKQDAERLNWLEQNQSGVYPVTERVRVPTTTMMPRYIDEWRFVSWSVSSRFDELHNIRNAIDAALAAGEDCRPCTCHPDDNPPRPCPRRYALGECREAALAAKEVE